MEMASQNIVSKVSTWWRSWTENSRHMDEILKLGYADLEGIAADCGITPVQLADLVRSGPHGSDEMLEMMKALNIDADAVNAAEPMMFRDMQVVCAECDSKGKCRRHLADGSAPATYNGYCGNSATLNELRAEPEMLAE